MFDYVDCLCVAAKATFAVSNFPNRIYSARPVWKFNTELSVRNLFNNWKIE